MGCIGERRKKIKRYEESGRSHSKAYLLRRVGIASPEAGIATAGCAQNTTTTPNRNSGSRDGRSARPRSDHAGRDTVRAFGRRAPNCGALAGPAESRFRPETPATPSAGALFFKRRPSLFDPLPNARFVALDGFARGLSWSPVHGVQQPTNVIDMIAHAEAAFDVLGDARTGPQVGGESRRLRPAQQLLFQLLALAQRQFRWSSAGRNGLQSGLACGALGALPATHAARIHLQKASDFSLRQILLEQIDGALPFALQLLRTALRSDRSPPHNKSGIGHYLCRNQ